MRDKFRRKKAFQEIVVLLGILFIFASLWILMPLNPLISSDIAVEILRSIIQINGLLIGFSGLIATFVMREIGSDRRTLVEYMVKKDYLSDSSASLSLALLEASEESYGMVKSYLILSTIFFVYSVWSCFHGLSYIVPTKDVYNNIILSSILFTFLGIAFLMFSIRQHPVHISLEDVKRKNELLKKLPEKLG